MSITINENKQRNYYNNNNNNNINNNNGIKLIKPDKNNLELLSNEIQNKIIELQNESKNIKKQIDNILKNKNNSKSEFDNAKNKMKELIAEKNQLIEEKNIIGTARENTRDKINARSNEEKTAKSELKFNNIESIDSQIRELEARQSRTTMSLQEEKKILKDIHNLQMSKKTLATISDMHAAIELLKAQKVELDRNFNQKSEQIKDCLTRIAEQRALIDNLNKDNATNRAAVPNLTSRQNDIKKEVDEKYQEIKALRAEFKAKEEAYYAALTEERQRKKEQKQKEIEARKIEEEARRKAEEEEELKRIPYEDEINLCDYLVTYLETKFPQSNSTNNNNLNNNSISSQLDSFNGLKVLVRNDEEFSTVAQNKKKNNKKKGGSNRQDTISHGVDTLESFSLLDIQPPRNTSSVQHTINLLKLKKASYQKLERGAVETLATKLKTERENKAKQNKKQSKVHDFNLEVDFPDLALNTTSPTISAPTTEETS